MIEPLLDRKDIQFNAPKVNQLNILECTNLGEREIPFVEPNVNPTTEIEDLERVIGNTLTAGLDCADKICLCIFCPCTCKDFILIDKNQYGFVEKLGKVAFLKPGWHFVGFPGTSSLTKFDINSSFMKLNNFQLIRIFQDEIGIGLSNTSMEILTPGTHVRTAGAYSFKGRFKLNQDITVGPIKIKTVRTGTVCVCYDNGVAHILREGRYCVNSNGFLIGDTIDITQQSLKFSQHKVLLEGGINMLIEGLLTYQIVNPEKLIKNVHIENLNRYLEEIMKADLTKIFSTIHLEQISSSTYSEVLKEGEDKVAETRLQIYQSIMKMIKPQADEWGIRIINFQLESVKLADQRYSLDYEKTSLQVAKSKAELRAVEAQNAIVKLKAETQNKVSLINAETEKKVILINAKAQAEARIIEAEANSGAVIKKGEATGRAADMMKSTYGKELALVNTKAKIAEGLKIHTLVLGGDSQASNPSSGKK